MWNRLPRASRPLWALVPVLGIALQGLCGCAAQIGPPAAMAAGDSMPRLINEDDPASLGPAPTRPPEGRSAPARAPVEPAEEPAVPQRAEAKPVLLADPPRPPRPDREARSAAAGDREARSAAAGDPAPAAAEPAPAGEKGGRVPYASQKGQIRRKELLAFLDKSPGAFLRNVESEPRFEQRRFRGWRIVSFFPGDPRFTGIDLVRGDVVTRINGRTIEQPDSFFLVWQELRAARELKVDLLREGQPHLSRWEIVD